MRVIAGISPININLYLNSDIDEFFCGYIPYEWFSEFGFEISLNRRYKSKQQFISKQIFEKTIISSKKNNKKIYITLNEQFYTNKQLVIIKRYVKYLEEIDIDGIIVADIHLLTFLGEIKFKKEIHLSGDFGIYNTDSLIYIIKKFKNLKINRLIFPREVLISEMKEIINYIKIKKLKIETEAFILGDPCIFNGSSCRASHGYGVDGLCYTMKYKKSSFSINTMKDIMIGGKKCGICFIKKLENIGVDVLKVPGRGNNFINEINRIITIIKGKKNYLYEKEKIINKYGKEYCNGNNCYYSIKEIKSNE